MFQIASRTEKIKPSATLAIAAKAKRLADEGKDVIGFGVGEPDFDTPAHITEAAIAALKGGDTRYTAVGGTPELKKAILAAVKRDYGFDWYAANQVLASSGAKHSLYNAFMAVLNPGDEVIIPAPYWVSYPEQVLLCGGEPVFLATKEEDDFAPNPEELKKLVTPKTRMLVLNSPSNPTGAMIDEATMVKLAEVIKAGNYYVLSDDIYMKLTYGGKKFVSILQVCPELKDRTIIINGVSKTYAMTGWRLGYALGPKEVISTMDMIQSQSTSNPTSFAQKGGVAALTGDQECVESMRKVFEGRRNLLVEGLNSLPGVTCRMPLGAFYALPNVSTLFGKQRPDGSAINNSFDLADYFLDSAGVAVVPGDPFGAPQNIRLSYAASESAIIKGLDRMKTALSALK